jgi:predicted Zn-dependent protease
MFNMKANAFEILSDSETEFVIRKLIAPILKVARINPKTLNLYIILDNSVNAFVIGGNNLFINTGLITTFNNPDALKGVVAHELGHVTGNHVAMRQSQVQELMSQSILVNLLGAAAIIGGAGEVGSALIAGGMHTLQGNYLRYSRFQETAADNAAIKYLHDSHNTIKGLIQVFEHFEQESLRLREHINPYMLTHPMSNDRLSFTRQFLKNENDTYQSSNQEKMEYAQIVAKLRGFTIPLESFSDKNIQDLPPSAQLYAKSIILYRKAKFKAAINILDQLINQSQPNEAFLYELKGQFLFESGNNTDAINSYKKAITILPDNPLILAEYAVVLVNASNTASGTHKQHILEEAITTLQKVLSLRLNNHPYVYRQLAVAYGKLGKLGYSNLMLAEEALLLHNFQEAKKFTKLAEKYKNQDNYLTLRIDDILKTLPKD